MGSFADGLELDEQIGQVVAAGFWGTTPSPDIIDLVQHDRVGSIILFSRNIQNAGQTLALTHRLQMLAQSSGQRYPLLIMADQENGIVHRLGPDATTFPGNMALAATSSERITHDVAQATGEELRMLGINMNLAPVVDVNNNPANPVIGVRSFGEDPRQVARFGAAAVTGFHDAGVMCTLKHFPGHGDTATDSHLALPIIPYDLERLESVELVPFACGIAAGADCVMIAHIAFPELSQQNALPATVSPALVRDLLRQRLGFDGVIISDCLEMNAVAETIGVERAAVMALQAGVDLMLISHHFDRQRGAIEAIREAVHAGVLPIATITEAAERVMRLKSHYLSWENVPQPAATTTAFNVSSGAHRRLRGMAYEQSTTLVRNDDGLLPLHMEPGERIIVISMQRDTVTKVEDRFYTDETLAAILRQHHPDVRVLSAPSFPTGDDYSAIMPGAIDTDIVVMATVNARLDERQAQLMRWLVQARRRVIGIAVRDPYDLQAFPQLRTYLVTYEYTQPALEAAARVLFGERQPQGQLPVGIPGLYARSASGPDL